MQMNRSLESNRYNESDESVRKIIRIRTESLSIHELIVVRKQLVLTAFY